MLKSAQLTTLLRDLKRQYHGAGRGYLPWRATRDPYKILVSEVMLQQTQVDRVLPYYERFIKKFPTAQTLARAKLSEVLVVWQGLGYNRRAKYLYEAAKVISAKTSRSGEINTTPTPAREVFAAQLPGVGPYTRGAVLAFAFNEPVVIVETNIRTVIFHYLPGGNVLSDTQLLPIVAELLVKSKMQPREFYWAMMDYGAHLKKRGVRLNSRSKHYAKQSKFEGSRRQKSAGRLRQALARGASDRTLERMLRSK